MFGKTSLPLLFIGLSALVTAQEVVDLGKLDQYDGKLVCCNHRSLLEGYVYHADRVFRTSRPR